MHGIIIIISRSSMSYSGEVKVTDVNIIHIVRSALHNYVLCSLAWCRTVQHMGAGRRGGEIVGTPPLEVGKQFFLCTADLFATFSH